MTTTIEPTRATPGRSARSRRVTPARVLAGAFLLLSATHLYWATGAVWPAPDEYTLSRAVLGFGADFGARITLPEAGLYLAAAALVLARERHGARRPLQAGIALLTAALLTRGVLGLLWVVPSLGHLHPPYYVLNLVAYTPLCFVLGWCGLSTLGVGARVSRAVAIAMAAVVALAALGAAYLVPLPAADSDVPPVAGATSHFVDTDLARFHYLKAGSGSPVVLLAPGASWAAAWQPQLQALAADHTVYAVDLPGQGYTTLTDDSFTYDLGGMTDAIDAFRDAVRLDQFALAGNSWSGGWALAYAQRHPERVTRLALLAASGLDRPDPSAWEMLKLPVVGRALTVLGSTDQTAVEDSLRKLAEHNLDDATVRDLARPSRFADNAVATHELEARLDWRQTEDALVRTAVPTLVLWGSEDTVLPVANAAVFGERLPDARVRILHGCGHGLTIDCPDEVNAAMRGFLDDQVQGFAHRAPLITHAGGVVVARRAAGPPSLRRLASARAERRSLARPLGPGHLGG
ncbi:alpha/beta fold hydrolase [Nocardioides speluncae]|uniref:alpha/beta fold hydrolase n=1 Tax=Nocardioides speluncae TaxID=2670337 RepID=UPI00137AF48D|nr:alpha/beta fold hydrolase [Nocardioides speluncae]